MSVISDMLRLNAVPAVRFGDDLIAITIHDCTRRRRLDEANRRAALVEDGDDVPDAADEFCRVVPKPADGIRGPFAALALLPEGRAGQMRVEPFVSLIKTSDFMFKEFRVVANDVRGGKNTAEREGVLGLRADYETDVHDETSEEFTRSSRLVMMVCVCSRFTGILRREGATLSASRYHTVARVGEIVEGIGHAVEVEGRAVAVFLVDGTYYAVDDLCPHQEFPLHDGIVLDCTLTCLYHGWRFRLGDGGWEDDPGSRSALPGRVRDGAVEVGVAGA